jgi:hypothetical protein
MSGSDDDRQSILSRRARFIAAAMAAMTGALSTAEGCSEVEIVDDDGSGTGGAEPQPCLSPALGGGGEGGAGGMPQPCLAPELGGGGEGGSGGIGGAGGSSPCLTPY